MPLIVDEADLSESFINFYDIGQAESFEVAAQFQQREAGGWRLPTRAELEDMLARHRAGAGNHRSERYMSSECAMPYRNWVLDFGTGEWHDVDVTECHWGTALVRLVRDAG